MTDTWTEGMPGVMVLPSRRRVRGRGLRKPVPAGALPEFALYLLGREPEPVGRPYRWVKWPDFRLPSDPQGFASHLRELLDRAGSERVEIACGGGVGRTGTALACLAVLDGVPAGTAVEYVRQNYLSRAVETPWQKRFVERFEALGC